MPTRGMQSWRKKSGSATAAKYNFERLGGEAEEETIEN